MFFLRICGVMYVLILETAFDVIRGLKDDSQV